MSNTETMQTRIRDPDAIPRIALYGFLAVVVGLSTVGWISNFDGPAGWLGAGVSAVNEVLIFFGLPKALAHIKAKRWGPFWALILVLVLASPISVLGVDQGLTVASRVVQKPIDDQVALEQRQRDDDRGRLQNEIATIVERLRALDAAMPNPETTNGVRQREWRNNRNTAAKVDEDRLPLARAELAALPETIAPRHAYPEWMRHMVAGLLFFISAIGRYSWGFEGAAREIRAPTPRKPKPSHDDENVIDLGTARDTRNASQRDAEDARTVRRMKDELSLSFREIETETKGRISKSRAARLYRAA